MCVCVTPALSKIVQCRFHHLKRLAKTGIFQQQNNKISIGLCRDPHAYRELHVLSCQRERLWHKYGFRVVLSGAPHSVLNEWKHTHTHTHTQNQASRKQDTEGGRDLAGRS